MPSKIHKNKFDGGMNTDSDKNTIKSNQYEAAINVTISQSGNYGKLSAIKDTALKAAVIANAAIGNQDDLHVMGITSSRIKTGSGNIEGAIVFIYNNASGSELLSVFAYTPPTTLTLLYSESVVLTDSKRFIDSVIYRENGIDYIYYADYEEAIKKIACDTTASLPLKREKILLLRTGFRGKISNTVVQAGNGGDLLCGTYQFSYRLINSVTNRYTKWAVISNPVIVGMTPATNTQPYGGVGFVSDANIRLTLALYQNYSTNSLYDYYQISVLENIDGSKEKNQTVKVLSQKALSDFDFSPLPSNPATATYDYSTNAPADELLTIDELTIDDAAIKSVRTLQIKHNRLIGGNVIYHDLDYTQGDPIVATTTTHVNEALSGGAMAYSDFDQATNKVGHWRDELYRYAISYFDEFFNYSRPKILDFSAVTANLAKLADWATSTTYVVGDKVRESSKGYKCIIGHDSVTFATDLGNGKWELVNFSKDYRFPDRDNGKYGTLLNSSDNVQALYLKLMGINNHPTWAKGFVILRAPRKKKVLFQTPLIPSILIQPARAKGDYPDQRKNEDSQFLDVLNVAAANPKGSYVPKNYFHSLPKSLVNQSRLIDVEAASGGIFYVNNTSIDLALYSTNQSSFYLLQISSTIRKAIAYSTLPSTDDIKIWKTFSEKIVTSGVYQVKMFRELLAENDWPDYPASPYETDIPYTTDGSTISTLAPQTYKYLAEITLL